jgi:HAE1 family hydrophobic/amphiphilic exporter-1
VAVTLVPVLCSKLLKLPPPMDQRKGLFGRMSIWSEQALEHMDDAYRRVLHKALAHRGIVVGLAAASVVAAALIFPTLSTEFTSQTDEGQVNVNVELAQGTRIEITDPVLKRIEESLTQLVPEATTVIVQAGSGGGNNFQGGGGSVSRGTLNLMLVPKDERKRSSEQIAQDLRRQLQGIPGVIGRRQQRRRPSVAGDPRRRSERLEETCPVP